MNLIKILILTANPSDTTRLALDQEVREIEAELERSTLRDRFEVISKGAVRVDDLVRALQRYKPQIVHFSGHGAGEQGLVLEDNGGNLQLVPNNALRELFRLYRGITQCVFLNACYSETQAEEIYQHIDCVIGMTRPVGDKTAIQFAPKFYASLAEGWSFQDAFDHAKAFLKLDSNKESGTPIQRIRQGTANLFSAINFTGQEPTMPPQVPQPVSQHSHTIGNISVNGNSNPINILQGNQNRISQNIIGHSTDSSANVQAAITALAQLKEAIATNDALSSMQRKMANVPIDEIEAELQKPKPSKGIVDEAIAALKQALESAITLAEPVTKVAALLAKAWMV